MAQLPVNKNSTKNVGVQQCLQNNSITAATR